MPTAPIARAVGAMVISPALQRGVSVPTKTEPESWRDGAQAPRPSNAVAGERKVHKPGATPGNVKLLLPPRQSRGFSLWQIAQRNNQNFCRLYPSISAQSIHEQQPAPRAFPVPCSLFPDPCSLFPVPCSLSPVPCSLLYPHPPYPAEAIFQPFHNQQLPLFQLVAIFTC